MNQQAFNRLVKRALTDPKVQTTLTNVGDTLGFHDYGTGEMPTSDQTFRMLLEYLSDPDNQQFVINLLEALGIPELIGSIIDSTQEGLTSLKRAALKCCNDRRVEISMLQSGRLLRGIATA